MATSTAQFCVGQVIHHKLFDYRGVIADVDPVFQGSDEWYEQATTTNPPKDQPWYHVLVDASDRETYVAERNLEIDPTGAPVEHPYVAELFGELSNGVYHRQRPSN